METKFLWLRVYTNANAIYFSSALNMQNNRFYQCSAKYTYFRGTFSSRSFGTTFLHFYVGFLLFNILNKHSIFYLISQ